MKRTILILMLAALLVTSVALANDVTLAIERWVIGGGGRHVEAGIYALDGTVGQAIGGVDHRDRYGLCSGFWCQAMRGHSLAVPLVLRND